MKMRLQSPEYRGCDEWKSTVAASFKAAIVLSTIGLAGVGISAAAAQEAASDAAYVEEVKGRVVAFARGAPVLLSALDVIADRTRIDLLADSELHICHHRMQRFLKLKGPGRITITTIGVANDAGKSIDASVESCTAPMISKLSGGLMTRGIQSKE
jgi:hypothetical protein